MPSLKQAYIRVLVAFVALILGTMLVAGGVVAGIGATIMFIVFALVFVSGTALWSMAKGRPGSLGIMLGLLGTAIASNSSAVFRGAGKRQAVWLGFLRGLITHGGFDHVRAPGCSFFTV